MPWSISITAEGWDDIRAALEVMPKEDLINAIMDDNDSKRQDFRKHWRNNPSFKRVRRIKRANLETLYQDTLSQVAYELVVENNTCDIGGFEYWIDIDGFHTVTLK